MTKKTLNISIIILSFGITALVQPALAAECVQMMGCMPTHSQSRLPDANDNHACTCTQTSQQLVNRGCSPLKREMTAPDIASTYHLSLGLPSRCDEQWIFRDALLGSYHILTDIAPSPHCPIFILNQSIIR